MPAADGCRDVDGDMEFRLLASWADSEHVAAAPVAPSIASLSDHVVASAAGLGSCGTAASQTLSDETPQQRAHRVASMRRQRCKTLVELDRLMAMSDGNPTVKQSIATPVRDGDARPQTSLEASIAIGGKPVLPIAGRLLRIAGEAMATSSQAEVLTGPI